MKGGRDAGGERRGGQGVMDGSRSAGPSAELKEGKGNEKMRGVVEDTSVSLGVSQFDSKSIFFVSISIQRWVVPVQVSVGL